MTRYPRRLERFISKWKPTIRFCPFIRITNERARWRRQTFGKWQITTAVVAKDKDRFLLVYERPSKAHLGGWSVPGGYVEEHEEFEEAAVREVLEEAGVQVRLFQPTILLRTVLKSPSERDLEYALGIFNGQISGGTLEPPDKAEIVEATLVSHRRLDRLIQNGEFPRMNPILDKPIVDFCKRSKS